MAEFRNNIQYMIYLTLHSLSSDSGVGWGGGGGEQISIMSTVYYSFIHLT